MTEWMTGNRRAALRAICDTVVLSIARTDDAPSFAALRASDVGAEAIAAAGHSARAGARATTKA